MVKSSEDSKKDMKVSEITIGKTTYILRSNAHLLDKKTILNKFAKIVLNEMSKGS